MPSFASPFAVGNLMLIASMLCSALGQIMIKHVMNGHDFPQFSTTSLKQLAAPTVFLQVSLAAMMIGSGFFFWVAALAKLDLSYAYPIASSSVLLVTLMSGVFLGEQVTLRVWIGTALVVLGVLLLLPRGVAPA
jgi:drug/metabolite transporter (DMT)-like permease